MDKIPNPDTLNANLLSVGSSLKKGVSLKEKIKTKKIKEEKKKSALRENIEAILVAVVLALFIRTFVVQAFKIPSGSMLNTLQIGDHILVNKFIYGVKLPFLQTTVIPVSEPKRGDIVVFKFPVDPSKDFIKRVIAVEGDTVEITDKHVYVNGQLQQNDYAIHLDPHIQRLDKNRDNFGPVTVPKNSIFVMGDNRDFSFDSRFWGFVDLKDVKGEAFIIYWSWNKDNGESFIDYVRWNRIGMILE
jgi:signal peptidase I